MASSSSSSSSMPGWKYDVFLSFHGKDTRNDFVACLHMFLSTLRGFRIFKDDEEVERGKFISPELVKNITESRIAVIVFSKNYASSSWCLDELVEILKCKSKGQNVLPLFYDVKPSEVMKQKGSFGEAFIKLEGDHTEDEVKRWRAALKEAAGICGLDLDDAANGNWTNFFEQIGKEISTILEHRTLKVADYEVGIDSQASKLIMLLNDRSKDKLFVGICGTGGIGKTTVTKAVFNRIFNEFERSCFLNNVREESTKHGLVKPQEELLRKTLMDNDIRISNIDVGIKEIEERLQHKKILIILDDVDDEKQLLYLVGIGHNWFGLGSRIIITTRNEWLLRKYGVKICKAKLLDDHEALELFSWHAFKQNSPKTEFLQLSNRVKKYAQGLPLALQVLGSLLCQKNMQYWVNQLDKLKRNPPRQIQDVLKISYDNLDENQRAIFLDIACFFKGYDKNFAIEFFESCEFQPVIEIEVLIERSLITISIDNKFLMHDLIQEMGREIVRQKSKNPGGPSRLWSYEDINDVFDDDTVPKNIEGIVLPKVSEERLIISADTFSKMKKLRILIISGVELLGCPKFLPNQLRYLQWNGYPGEYLPQLPESLVRLELPCSHIKQIPLCKNFHRNLKVINLNGCKYLVETLNFYELPRLEELNLRGCESVVEVEFHGMMKNLRWIDLNHCDNLKKSPNLSRLPCLEKLYLGFCKSLVEVDPSIEFHERLVELDFTHSENLKSLATRINLKSLRFLDLNNCSKLEKFPEIEGDMECLHQLDLCETAIKELPSSVKRLKGLTLLWLKNCKMIESLPNSIGEMKSLEELDLDRTPIKDLPPSVVHLKGLERLYLRDCKMLESLSSNIGGMETLTFLNLAGSCIRKLPSSISQLTHLRELHCDNCNLDEESILNLPHSLKRLNLSRNNFAGLPPSFTQLTELYDLRLDGCLSLQTLESLPSSIERVSAQGCVSLERYSIPTRSEDRLFVRRDWIFTENHKLVENHGKKKPNIYSESLLEDIGDTCILLPGGVIPSWFNHICESGEDPLCLMVDPNSWRNLKGIAVCAVIGFDHEPWDYISLCINGYDEVFLDLKNWVKSSSDHIMLSHRTHVLRPDPWMKKFHPNHVPVKECWLMGNSDACYIQASIKDVQPLKVKKWGIHLIMDAPPPQPTQVYTDHLSATNKLLTYKRKRKRTAEEDR